MRQDRFDLFGKLVIYTDNQDRGQSPGQSLGGELILASVGLKRGRGFHSASRRPA